MSTNALGFVYILTNPNFREDWVKIGKSSRSVDVFQEFLLLREGAMVSLI